MAGGRGGSVRSRRGKSGVNALTWETSSALAVGLYIVVQFVLPAATIDNPVTAAAAQVLRPIGTILALCLVCFAVFLYIKENSGKRASNIVAGETALAPAALASMATRAVTNLEVVAHGRDQMPRPSPQQEKPAAWSIELLRQIEWKRIEELTAAYFREKTFRTETIAAGPDGGIDVKLFVQGKDEPFAVVQCKAWNTRDVGVAYIRELLGVMAHQKVLKGMFVTTGDFTGDAIAFAKTSPISLITGEMLFKGICALPVAAQQRLLDVATEGDYLTPTCPSCGIKTVRRSGKKGEFWGCQNYPRCRQSFDIR